MGWDRIPTLPQKLMMQNLEIRVKGHLDPKWAEWFDGVTLTHTEDGDTILGGTVRDQAAIYGLIAKLRDLGVSLVSIRVWNTSE